MSLSFAPEPGWLHCRAMRRVLLVVLVVLLSLQWTWAVAAAYCKHEVGAAASHLGHHAHEHEGHDAAGTPKVDAAAPDVQADTWGPDAASFQGADADCGACHAGATALMAAPPAEAWALTGPGAVTPYLRAVTEGVPERLIRPPLQRLA